MLAHIENKKGETCVKTPLVNSEQTVEVEYFYTNSPEIKEYDKIKFVKTQRISHDKWFI